MNNGVMSGIFALAGVTLGGVNAAASTAYSGRLADRRSLRDQRLARLRTAFAPLLHSARVLPYVVHRRKYLVEGESQETRDARLDEQFRETLQGVDEAEVALSLEATADVAVVRARLQEVRDAYTRYQVAMGSRLRGEARLIDLTGTEEKVAAAVQALETAMTEVLRTAELPVPLLNLRPWHRR